MIPMKEGGGGGWGKRKVDQSQNLPSSRRHTLLIPSSQLKYQANQRTDETTCGQIPNQMVRNKARGTPWIHFMPSIVHRLNK